MPICDSCGHETMSPARTCERCGAALPGADPTPPRDEQATRAGQDPDTTLPSPTPFPAVDPEHRAAGPGKARLKGADEPGEEAGEAVGEGVGEPIGEEGGQPVGEERGEAAGEPTGEEGGEGAGGPPGGAPPPPSRRSPALGFLLALLAVLVVGGIGAGIYFGLVKDNGDGGGSDSSAKPSPSTPPTDTAGGRSTGREPNTTATFLVNACGALSPTRRCVAPAFTRSRNRKQFYIWMLVRKAPQGRKVQILMKDASTGRDLVRPTRYTTTGASRDIFTLRISGGPFRPLRALIRVKYGTDFVRFPRPLRITLR